MPRARLKLLTIHMLGNLMLTILKRNLVVFQIAGCMEYIHRLIAVKQRLLEHFNKQAESFQQGIGHCRNRAIDNRSKIEDKKLIRLQKCNYTNRKVTTE